MSRSGKAPVLLVLVVALLLSMFLWTTAAAETKKDDAGCVKPAEGPIGSDVSKKHNTMKSHTPVIQRAMVGGKAPNFEANAFHNGKFKNVKLSDYKGKWVVLCFYPGDFTFV